MYEVTSAIFISMFLLALNILHLRTLYILLLRIFIALEFILICTFYRTIFTNPTMKTVLTSLVFIFIGFCIFNYIQSPKTKFDIIPLVVESFFFTIVILYYFYDVMHYNLTIPLFQLANFWISFAFLIYFSGNFFVFLFSKLMENEPNFHVQYTTIYSSITIIKDILLCTGLLLNKNPTQKDTTSLSNNVDLGSYSLL